MPSSVLTSLGIFGLLLAEEDKAWGVRVRDGASVTGQGLVPLPGAEGSKRVTKKYFGGGQQAGREPAGITQVGGDTAEPKRTEIEKEGLTSRVL